MIPLALNEYQGPPKQGHHDEQGCSSWFGDKPGHCSESDQPEFNISSELGPLLQEEWQPLHISVIVNPQCDERTCCLLEKADDSRYYLPLKTACETAHTASRWLEPRSAIKKRCVPLTQSPGFPACLRDHRLLTHLATFMTFSASCMPLPRPLLFNRAGVRAAGSDACDTTRLNITPWDGRRSRSPWMSTRLPRLISWWPTVFSRTGARRSRLLFVASRSYIVPGLLLNAQSSIDRKSSPWRTRGTLGKVNGPGTERGSFVGRA